MTYLVTVANQTTHFSKFICRPGQLFWDRPGVLEDKTLVEATLSSAYHRASFLYSCLYAAQWGLAICPPYCLMWLDIRR